MRQAQLSLLFLALAVPTAHAAEYLELTDFQLIDGTGAPARRVHRLVARDGVIVTIDGQGEMPKPEPDARWLRIGLNGAWVLPGLIDTHVHVARFPDTSTHAKAILERAVRGGVTSVRDLAGDARALADIERAVGDTGAHVVCRLEITEALREAAEQFLQASVASSARGGVDRVLEHDTLAAPRADQRTVFGDDSLHRKEPRQHVRPTSGAPRYPVQSQAGFGQTEQR